MSIYTVSVGNPSRGRSNAPRGATPHPSSLTRRHLPPQGGKGRARRGALTPKAERSPRLGAAGVDDALQPLRSSSARRPSAARSDTSAACARSAMQSAGLRAERGTAARLDAGGPAGREIGLALVPLRHAARGSPAQTAARTGSAGGRDRSRGCGGRRSRARGRGSPPDASASTATARAAKGEPRASARPTRTMPAHGSSGRQSSVERRGGSEAQPDQRGRIEALARDR